MKFRKLGQTDLDVSLICLGTMTWGEQNTEAEGHEQMDYALERGINFFDTAELYSIPPKAETQGSTETIIGTWFSERKNRDKVILASKVVGRSPMAWFREDGGQTRQTKEQIHYACEQSLKRLQTDYIDVYQLHWPDRPMQLFGSGGHSYSHNPDEFESTRNILEGLKELVDAGKIRYVALSNETPWGVASFLQASEAYDLPRVVSIQNAYNLLNRTFEMGLSEFSFREQVGLLAYSPLAQGYLSGKYRNGALPEKARKTLFGRMGRYESEQSLRATNAYCDLAQSRGLDPSQMALAFVNMQPFVTSNIIGATTMEQLKNDIDSVDIELDDECLAAINAIHSESPNPAP